MITLDTKNILNKIAKVVKLKGLDLEKAKDLLDAAYAVAVEEKDRDYALKVIDYIKEIATYTIKKTEDEEIASQLDNFLQYTLPRSMAYWDFDTYLLFIERKRPKTRRFYEPRRKCLLRSGVIQALQDLEDDKLDIISISMPPGTGKTSIEKFFATWVIGRHIDDYSLFYSHSDDIVRMFYDGIMEICTGAEYGFLEVFPYARLESKDAKREIINFGEHKSFASIQCSSVGAKNAGKVRCNRYLYCDDLIGSINEALNKPYLDKLWNTYGTDARQRKMDGCKEIHIATRWSVHDVIGRLQKIYEGDKRTRFIAIPDIDEQTGKSNFKYDREGFTVAFFESQQAVMDDITYRCLYKQQPVEREGILVHEDDLRTYVTLPEGEPDAVLSVVDTKNKGSDYFFQPIMYQYGKDYYFVDCICSNSADYNIQYDMSAKYIVEHKVKKCQFESNSGGDRVALEVSKRVKAMNWACNITTKFTTQNKETKIIVNMPWVLQNVLFKDKSLYKPKSDYGVAMKYLLSYSQNAKNEHDDVPDGLTQFALFVETGMPVAVRVVNSPF